MVKKFYATVAVLLAMFLLSGCYKLKADVALDPANETVSGVVNVTVPVKYFSQMKGQLPTSDLPPGITATPVSNKGMKGYSYTLTSVPIADLTADGAAFLPVKVVREKTAYVLVGDFTNWFYTSKSLKQDNIKVKGKVPAPAIDFKFTFPDPVTDAPKGASLDGNTVKLSGPWVRAHKKFRIVATHDFNTVAAPSFDDFPSADRSIQDAYPLPHAQRNEIPLYFFGLMVGGGLITIILAHYGNVSRAASSSKSKNAKKKK